MLRPSLISFDDVSLSPFAQPLIKIVITGFNTDIERDGVVYHVQTEDKGLDSPLILSLVYSGGEILAAKRTPYEDLIAAGFNDEVLSERLKRQHRLICAAISAGRIDDLKRMSSRADGVAQASIEPGIDVEHAPIIPPGSAPDEVREEFEIENFAASREISDRSHPAPGQIPDEFEIELDAEIRERPFEIHEEFVIETAAERPPVPEWRPPEEVVAETVAEAPETIADLPMDQDTVETQGSPAPQESVYTVYDSRKPSKRGASRKPQPDLVLTILNDEEFRAGETVTIRVLLQYCLGESEKPLGGVPLSVKVLGTTFRPRIYHVNTQRDGIGIVSVEIPPFTSGRAAVLIRAEAQDQSTELRRAIQAAD